MPVKSMTVTDTYVEVDRGNGAVLHFDFADFPPSADTNETRQAHIIAHVQDWLDYRVKLRNLEDGDPNKTIDPALPHLFWEGTGGNAEIVQRNIVIENVTYDSAKAPPLEFSLRKLWP